VRRDGKELFPWKNLRPVVGVLPYTDEVIGACEIKLHVNYVVKSSRIQW